MLRMLLLLLVVNSGISGGVTMTQGPAVKRRYGTEGRRRAAWRCPASRDQNALDDINLRLVSVGPSTNTIYVARTGTD